MSKSDSLEVMKRCGKTGRFVKRECYLEEVIIPSSIINVVKREYIDIEPILQKIIQTRSDAIYEKLEDKYSYLIDLTENYRSFGEGCNKIVDTCEKLVVGFDRNVSEFQKQFTPYKLDLNEFTKKFEPIKGYVNCLFIYLYASTIRYRERIVKETSISNYILKLQIKLGEILESLLDSIYQDYILEDPSDLEFLPYFAEFDSRYSSAIEIMQTYLPRLLCVKYNHWGRKFEIAGDCFSSFVRVRGCNCNTNFCNCRIHMAFELISLLKEVQKLTDIREEFNNIIWTDEEFKLIEKDLFLSQKFD